jgi:hypothetical protein
MGIWRSNQQDDATAERWAAQNGWGVSRDISLPFEIGGPEDGQGRRAATEEVRAPLRPKHQRRPCPCAQQRAGEAAPRRQAWSWPNWVGMPPVLRESRTAADKFAGRRHGRDTMATTCDSASLSAHRDGQIAHSQGVTPRP